MFDVCCCTADAAGADGSIVFWLLGQSEALTKIEAAHENQINGLAFHPMGHEMTTCKHNQRGSCAVSAESSVFPGMSHVKRTKLSAAAINSGRQALRLRDAAIRHLPAAWCI